MKKKQTNKLPFEIKPPTGFFEKIHLNVMNLNNSKFFAGVVMIMLNVGSKFIPIQFSKSAEEYLKKSLSKIMLVFAMSWMGTRDIYTAMLLTGVFVILSDYLFNEESLFCIVPHSKRILDSVNGFENNNNNTNSTSNSTNLSTNEELAKQTIQLIETKKKIIEEDSK
jgi:hypothetical protein